MGEGGSVGPLLVVAARAWRDLKLELQRVETMDRAAWDRWVAAEVAKL
jgi:hypothetical protein